MRIANWAIRMIAFIALIFILQGCVSQGKYDELVQLNKKRGELIAENEARIGELESENSNLRQKLKEAEATSDALLDETKKLEAEKRKASERAKELTKQLEALAKKFEGEVIQTPRGPAYRIKGKVLFDSGKADLKEEGEKILKGLARVLSSGKEDIEIHGHTDTDPILYSGWVSNHHLSAARALSVFTFLKKVGIPEKRMMIAGFGPNKPVVPNDTPKNKQQNRRVEILIVTAREGALAKGSRVKTPSASKTIRARKGTSVIERKTKPETPKPEGESNKGKAEDKGQPE